MARPPGFSARERATEVSHHDDRRKPTRLRDIHGRSWVYVLRKTGREFYTDQAPDIAAALTFYGVLAILPTLLAFVSLAGLFGDPTTTTETLLELIGGIIPQTTVDFIREPLQNLATSRGAGLALAVGIVGALFSASNYVTAFSRAMNRIYDIHEGRPFWKLRPLMLGITVVVILVAVAATLALAVSGPIAEQVGEMLGLGSTALLVWRVARWPLLAFLAVLIVAVLYYATPNVKQPKFRWMSLGALVALIVWIAASGALAFFVTNVSSLNRTYGAVGGALVFLLWAWISNMALVFGAELDGELERGRQLQAGIRAEETIQLQPRDTAASDRALKTHEKDVAAGRRLRRSATTRS